MFQQRIWFGQLSCIGNFLPISTARKKANTDNSNLIYTESFFLYIGGKKKTKKERKKEKKPQTINQTCP